MGPAGTVYTPTVIKLRNYAISTAGTNAGLRSHSSSPGLVTGNSAAVPATNSLEFMKAGTKIDSGKYMISYNVTMLSAFAGRSCVGIYARPFNSSGGGGADVAGSRSVMYYRFNTYGEYNTHACTFYFDTASFSGFNHLRFGTELLDGTLNHSTHGTCTITFQKLS